MWSDKPTRKVQTMATSSTTTPPPTAFSAWREFVGRCLGPICLEPLGMSRYHMDPDRLSFVHARCLGIRDENHQGEA